MMEYLEGEEPTVEETETTLRKTTCSMHLFQFTVGSHLQKQRRMQMQFIFSAEGIAENLRHSILIRMVLCCSRKGLTETAGSSGRGMLRKPVF